ncbi:MAG TPA: hypothetical protein VHX52_08785 [Steroidobacteraceae bacterium]|nr:hypothetical protein [Steroidobacteraceae bacterium]
MVRFGDPNGAAPPPPGGASTAGAPRFYAPVVSEIFAISQGKIMEIQAIFTSPTERLQTPFDPTLE